LHDFDIKQHSFTINGWVNVFWKWDKPPKRKGLPNLYKIDSNADDNAFSIKSSSSNMTTYKNDDGHNILKVLDLRDCHLTYFLPIDATKIFNQPSLVSIKHNEPPCLYFNQDTHIAHSHYNIRATLSEQLEQFLFPFDREVLNIKLRWNVLYYDILHLKNEKHIPLNDKWFGVDPSRGDCERSIELYHTDPIKITLHESIAKEVKIQPVEVDTRFLKIAVSKRRLRFVLIRLPVHHKPAFFLTNILFPVMLIASSSFCIFTISRDIAYERLAVSVAILLTFTSFQSFTANTLPQASERKLIDWYISAAYLLQVLLIASSCVVSVQLERGVEMETVEGIEWTFGVALGAIWVLFSMFYLSLKFETMQSVYARCCCCCRKRRIHFNDWNALRKQQFEDYNTSERLTVDFKVKDVDNDGKPADVEEKKAVCCCCSRCHG